jgi:riboflavin synthase
LKNALDATLQSLKPDDFMFTGIITAIGVITHITDQPGLRRLRIAADYDASTIAIGASISCGGPCMTVIDRASTPDGCWFDVEVAKESIDITNAAQWQVGTRLNLERSLKIGDELGGHIVTGHIDGLGLIKQRDDVPGGVGARFWVEAPQALSHFIASKGSVTLDGTSLTVNSVEGDVFDVLLIPHTLQVTSWGMRKAGDTLNLEVDLMARYAARLAQGRTQGY